MFARLLNNPVVRYFRDAREELRKVTWPSRREVLLYSTLVVVISIITAAYLGLLDWLFSLGLAEIVKRTH